MKAFAAFVLTALTASVSLPATAQFAKAEDAVHYRQGVMTVMGNHFYRRLGAMANGRAAYDPKQAVDSAALVEILAKQPWGAFGEGTDKVGRTAAKADIWKDPAKFKELAEKMMVEVANLNTAAKAGTLDALKAAYGPAARTCKACHDKFTDE